MCSYLPTRIGLRDVGEKWNSQFGCLGRPIGVARASPMLPGVCVGVFRSLDDVAMDGALPRIRTESSAHMDPHVMVISCQLSRRVENQKKEYRKPKNPEPRTQNPEPRTQNRSHSNPMHAEATHSRYKGSFLWQVSSARGQRSVSPLGSLT